MSDYKIVEKKNPLAVHGYFDSLERAQWWLIVHVPMYCDTGYFTDKTLTPDSFTIVKGYTWMQYIVKNVVFGMWLA